MIINRILRTLLFCLLLFAVVQQAAAQNKVISGFVYDEKNNPIQGATITVKNSSIGTVTDSSGSFSLSVPSSGKTLTVSFVGLGSQEINLNGKSSVSVVLTPAGKQSLSDVVIVGYGTARKKDLTGSVTTISAKDFNKGNITSPEQLIAGKVAGVHIVSNGGAPGSGSTIRIRGGASLSASNDPLIVVDGVPLDNGSISGAPNGLSLINPNDIETFNILKDASATAIYGSRASNGVLIITTKKGRNGKPVVNFNSQFSVSTHPKQVEVLSADQLKEVVGKQNVAAAKNLVGTANTNWQDVIFHNALTEDNNVAVSGALGGIPYRVSAGFLNQDGILKTSNLRRASGAVNLNPSLFQNHLKIDIHLKGSSSDNRFANQDAIVSALFFDPTHPVYSGNNRFGGFFEWIDPSTNKPNVLAPRNPLGLLLQKEDKSNVQRSIGNVQFDYKFHFLPALHANLNLGYDVSRGKGTIYVPDSAASDYGNGGVNNKYLQKKSNKLLEAYFNYTKELASIGSRIDAVAGYSYQDFLTTNYNYASFNAKGDTIPNTQPKFAFDKPQNTLISFFGRLNYGFKNRYLFTASVRRDGSSRFAPENRWGWFPAAAFAWRMKEEGFLKSSKTFSDLKLRLGYGITGQQDIGLNYSYLGTYNLSNQTAQYQLGDQFYNMYRPTGYNPNLKWEQTATYNAGLDFGFINNRITGTLDFYYRQTTDLLNDINQPAGANFTNRILANIGSMRNKGVELNISATPVQTQNFTWDAGFNISYNQNKITKLTAVADPAYPGTQYGDITGGVNNTVFINSVGFNRGSFYVYKQVYDNAGKPVEGKYEDLSGDGIINEKDLYRYKSADPKVYLGFSSNLTYKKWSGSFVMRGSFGNYMYNNIYSAIGTFRNIYNLPNFLSNASVNYLATGFENNQFLSDYYVQNASFLRMDNVTVGYNVGKVFQNKANLTLNGTVQNVFVLTPYKGLDPEVSNGIDIKIYPRPRIFTLGLNLNF